MQMRRHEFVFIVSFLSLFLFFANSTCTAQQTNIDSVVYYNKKLQDQDALPLDSILFYYKKAVFFANDTMRANLLRKEGVYLMNHDLPKAGEKFLQHALDIVRKKSIKNVEARIYHDLGYRYYMLNKNYLALEYFIKAKKIYLELHDEDNIQIINSNIATFLEEDGKYKEALDLYNQSLQYYYKLHDSLNILNTKLNIANLIASSVGHKQAISLLKSLELDPHWDFAGRSLVNYNLAINYFLMHENSTALEHIDKAITFSKQIHDDVQLIDLYRLKAEIENQLGNYQQANQFVNLSLKGAQKIDDLPFQIELYKLMISFGIKQKNYAHIQQYFDLINKIQDTLSQREKMNSYKEVLLATELQDKEALAKEQARIITKEKKRKQLYLALIIFGLLSFTTLSLLFYLSKLNYKKSSKLEAQKMQMREMELASKKRELLVSLLFVKKRKEKLKIINTEIDKLANRSVINKNQVLELKDFVTKKAMELDEEENVQQRLVSTHKDFFNQLLKDYPDLSKTELKILAYLRIGLTTKEIADVQYVSIDAVRKSRYRIRKKLHLAPSQSLEKFILQF